MKSCNPLVGDNAYETLDGMIEALQWQITQLSRFMKDPSEETLKAGLTVEEIHGECLLLHCLNAAAKVCYIQSCEEQNQQTQADGQGSVVAEQSRSQPQHVAM